MHSLVYRSVASGFFSMAQVYKMLSDARDNSVRHDIMGCLLYHNITTGSCNLWKERSKHFLKESNWIPSTMMWWPLVNKRIQSAFLTNGAWGLFMNMDKMVHQPV